MLEFKEVQYLSKLTTTLVRGSEVINTAGCSSLIDYDRGYYWSSLTALPGVPNIPWHCVQEGTTLYIMKEEPNFYA